MHTPVGVQVWRVSVLFLLGIGANALFQFYTAFRSVFHPRRLANHALDFLMGVLIVGSFAVGVFVTSWGEVRSYVPVAIGLGYVTGDLFAGDITYRAGRSIFAAIRKALVFLGMRVIAPVNAGLRKVARFARRDLIPPGPPWK